MVVYEGWATWQSDGRRCWVIEWLCCWQLDDGEEEAGGVSENTDASWGARNKVTSYKFSFSILADSIFSFLLDLQSSLEKSLRFDVEHAVVILLFSYSNVLDVCSKLLASEFCGERIFCCRFCGSRALNVCITKLLAFVKYWELRLAWNFVNCWILTSGVN